MTLAVEPHSFEEVRSILLRHKNGGYKYRELAAMCGYDNSKIGLLSDMVHGRIEHVSFAALNDLRKRLGLSYEVSTELVVPGDMNAEVRLTPGSGEVVVRTTTKRTRKKYYRPCLDEKYKEFTSGYIEYRLENDT